MSSKDNVDAAARYDREGRGRVQSAGGVHHEMRGLQEQLREEALQPVHLQVSRRRQAGHLPQAASDRSPPGYCKFFMSEIEK